jgi:hypothetical protein
MRAQKRLWHTLADVPAAAELLSLVMSDAKWMAPCPL